MPNSPLISVVMPAYNAKDFISPAIESVLNQSYKNLEIIILNDASTDTTGSIIEKYAALDKRIKALTNDKNLNIAESRNRGVAACHGEFIVTMDSDDVCLPDRIANQLEFLQNNPSLAVCIGNIRVIDERGVVQYERTYPLTDDILRKKVFKYNPFPNPTIMCRKEVYEKTGLYDNKYVPIDDFDFWLRAGVNFRFGNCNKTVLLYRIVSKSASHGKLRKTERLTFILRKKAYSLGYMPVFSDVIYNILHLVSFLILPTCVKIKLFNLLRKIRIIS